MVKTLFSDSAMLLVMKLYLSPTCLRARPMLKPNVFEVISTFWVHSSYLSKDAIEVAWPVSSGCTGDQKAQPFRLEY